MDDKKIKEAIDNYIGKEKMYNPAMKERFLNGLYTNREKRKKYAPTRLIPSVSLLFLLFGGAFFYYISVERENNEVINQTHISHPKLENSEGSLIPNEEIEKYDRVENSSEKEIKKKLLALTEELFSLLKESNYEKIAEKVDPEHGVTFAFYADFGHPNGYGGQYVNLSKKDISKKNDTKYIWGMDESEKEFEMSLDEYVQQFLLRRWGWRDVDYSIVTFNEPAENFAGVINTVHEFYPNAKYVEYYSPGETEHLFQSLRFIYQERDGEWFLIGIARDVATV